jgi:gamma-glutamylcyclotransferase
MASQDPSVDIDHSSFTCLYFGFASNLSPRTLQSRCPGSLYVGLGRLRGYKFIISELGFGNIVRTGDEKDEVYGALYFLTGQHERAMDEAEMHVQGEGTWHEKRKVKVQRLETTEGSEAVTEVGEVETTTYIDLHHTVPGTASKENLTFLRRAVDDGIKCGVPRAYFEGSWRRFLPEDESAGRQEEMTMVRTLAMDKEEAGRWVPRDVLKLAGDKRES